MSSEREQVEAARQKVKVFHSDARYTDSGIGTGVIQANDGVIGESMMAPDADGAELAAWIDAASRLPGYEWRLNEDGHRETRPIVRPSPQPLEAAQVESGAGLPPLDVTPEEKQLAADAMLTRMEKFLSGNLLCRERQLKSALAEIERLKGLLREAFIVMSGGEGCNSPFDAERWSNAVLAIKAAVTGE